MSNKRVVVAMSGGVDSSVACALLAKEGHEVIGMTLRLWTPSPWKDGERYGGCCSPRDIAEAKEVCRQLNVPHYTFDMEEKFKEKVVDNFVEEYRQGRTPNPCVRCNSFIKFNILLKYALAAGAETLATGHYAQIEPSGAEYLLKKAEDPTKDQSYFLHMLNQGQLSRLLFPVGKYPKSVVRKIAEELNLVTAKKEDSQDVCFLEGRNYRDFLKERATQKPQTGQIQTKDGKVLGEHEGLPYYTIGQREKLGIATGQRLYVLEKNSETNTLVVGSEEETLSQSCLVEQVNWCSEIVPSAPIAAKVKIRYRHPGVLSKIFPLSNQSVKVVFETPQSSVSPGQSAVFYDGNTVLGGGLLASNHE
ncbi:MAG: tRNA 2-thiouridine(34) synthase MnmA [Elusimicrobia bacterium]|nr:tRNA 2-thiouridine(34) synthase MnmA [Elusimicrobiota bacterium]